MRLIIAIAVFCVLWPTKNSVAAPRDELVFAAASMREAMLEIGQAYEARCGCDVRFSFAASSALARQISAGAPATVFISANRRWMAWLSDKQKLSGEPRVIARNRLVVAANAETKQGLALLEHGRFAMGDPVGVPAGIYAKEALTTLGLWNEVRPNAVYTTNVRVALSMISRGDLAGGIVYSSDLRAEPNLHVQFTFPQEAHTPIEYLAASVGVRESGFLAFLSGDAAQATLTAAGFLQVSP